MFKDIIAALGKEFKLSEEELNELLPSGQSLLFASRVGWARTYLKKAGLLDAPKRGILSISARGIEILKKNPKKIDNTLLRQFPEFIEFQNLKKDHSGSPNQIEPAQIDKQTPEETIDVAYQNIRQSLAQELIDTVCRLTPAFFERLVVELLVKMDMAAQLKMQEKQSGKREMKE